MSARLTDVAAIEAKAMLELMLVAGKAGVADVNALTTLERILFVSGYKLGYATGANDAIDTAQEIVGAAK